jgi:hypothetical protein
MDQLSNQPDAMENNVCATEDVVSLVCTGVPPKQKRRIIFCLFASR